MFYHFFLSCYSHSVFPQQFMTHELPDLPYNFAALEPHIDAQTMEIHYSKHHAGYVAKLNAAIAGTSYAETDLIELMQQISNLPANLQTPVRNNGGGHYNHSLFWANLTPNKQSIPADLAAAIAASFGSTEAFKEQFATAAAGRFGSGWTWLIVKNGALQICSTANQDNPLMGEDVAECSGTPILALDVWEHAYYLHYQNRRPDYIAAFWNVVNWEVVNTRYMAAMSA